MNIPPFLRTLLPGTFEGNIRIRKLWLSHNPGIRSLAGYAFPAIPHLRTVDLVRIRSDEMARWNFITLKDI